MSGRTPTRSISGPMTGDTATATPARTDRASPMALTEAPTSRPISTTSGASTTIADWVATVATTSGTRLRRLLDDGDGVPGRDRAAFAHAELLDRAGHRGGDLVLHLHRLDHA